MSQKFYFVVSKIPEALKLLIENETATSILETVAAPKYAYLWCGYEWSWLIQTFLHLKKSGLNVELVEKPVENEICITHFVVTKNKVWGPKSFVVGIRADTSPMRMQDFEVVQSPAVLSNKKSHIINHWPQSHLKPRAAERGNQIKTISYFGGPGSIAPTFYSDEFKSALAKMDIALNLRFDADSWKDYSDTDLTIAVRNHHHPLLIDTKPASKLVNSWQAGCVALLGKEPAYRAVGTSGKNYFEIESPQDVLTIVAKLKADPSLYQKVCNSGMQEYSNYSFAAIEKQWTELLTGPVSEAFIEWKATKGKRDFLRYSLRCYQSAQQWLDHKLFYIPVRSKALLEKWETPGLFYSQ